MVVISKRVIKPNDDPDPAPCAGCWLGTVSAEPGAGICHMLIPHLMLSYALLCYACIVHVLQVCNDIIFLLLNILAKNVLIIEKN